MERAALRRRLFSWHQPMRPFSSHRLRVTAVIAGSLSVLAFAACGSSSPATTATSAVKPSATLTVKFGEYFYRPKIVTVHVGQPLRFVNVGKIEHTVADTTAAGAIRSALIKPRPLAHGAAQTVTFKRAGTVPYLCTFHPDLMRGVIHVVP